MGLQVRWLQQLSKLPEVGEVPPLSAEANAALESAIVNFGVEQAAEVKAIEKRTNHDVKAIEYFLKDQFRGNKEISDVLEFFHFACTSEDINNLSHALQLREAVQGIVIPAMDQIIAELQVMSHQFAEQPMLSRTHGQVSTPGHPGAKNAKRGAERTKGSQGTSLQIPPFSGSSMVV